MTTAAAPSSTHDRIVRALHRLAVHQGHTVPGERLATLARDLAPYDWPAIIAALDAHRKASRYFPQFPELRRLLEPEPPPQPGLRGQSPTFRPHRLASSTSVAVVDPDYRGAPYRFHCAHTPTCATWPAHRDQLLGDDPASTLEDLNAAWRTRQERAS